MGSRACLRDRRRDDGCGIRFYSVGISESCTGAQEMMGDFQMKKPHLALYRYLVKSLVGSCWGQLQKGLRLVQPVSAGFVCGHVCVWTVRNEMSGRGTGNSLRCDGICVRGFCRDVDQHLSRGPELDQQITTPSQAHFAFTSCANGTTSTCLVSR